MIFPTEASTDHNANGLTSVFEWEQVFPVCYGLPHFLNISGVFKGFEMPWQG